MRKNFFIFNLIVGFVLIWNAFCSAEGVVVIPLLGDEPVGNATVGDVLVGKTFSNSSATGLIGTRPPASVEKTGQTVSYENDDDGDYEKGEEICQRWATGGDPISGFGKKDHSTGLIWQDPVPGIAGAWGGVAFNALKYCEELVTGGQFSDWRLPNVKELQSLIDFGQSGPALAADHPFSGVQNEEYWTSTTWEDADYRAWTVDLNSGLTQFENKINSNRIWCVRGPY